MSAQKLLKIESKKAWIWHKNSSNSAPKWLVTSSSARGFASSAQADPQDTAQPEKWSRSCLQSCMKAQQTTRLLREADRVQKSFPRAAEEDGGASVRLCDADGRSVSLCDAEAGELRLAALCADLGSGTTKRICTRCDQIGETSVCVCLSLHQMRPDCADLGSGMARQICTICDQIGEMSVCICSSLQQMWPDWLLPLFFWFSALSTQLIFVVLGFGKILKLEPQNRGVKRVTLDK